MTLQPLGPDKIDKIIQELKNSKACGLDGIDTQIIKMARKELVPAITHIVNLSITTRTFPQKWKTAKIVPLWKGKDAVRTNPKSYRPVALLPIVSKILERVLHEQILIHMEKKNFAS